MARKRLGEILIDAKLLTQENLEAALAEQKRWGGKLGKILVDMRLVHEEHLVRALSAQMNLPAINLDTVEISPEAVAVLDGNTAEKMSVIPFRIEPRFLSVAMASPNSLDIVEELRVKTKRNIRPFIVGPNMIQRALLKYYNKGKSGFTHDAGKDFDPNNFEIVHKEGGARVTVTPVEGAVGNSGASKGSHAHQVGAKLATKQLEDRIARLEAMVTRDEDVIRRLLELLVEKKVASRDEVMNKLYK